MQNRCFKTSLHYGHDHHDIWQFESIWHTFHLWVLTRKGILHSIKPILGLPYARRLHSIFERQGWTIHDLEDLHGSRGCKAVIAYQAYPHPASWCWNKVHTTSTMAAKVIWFCANSWNLRINYHIIATHSGNRMRARNVQTWYQHHHDPLTGYTGLCLHSLWQSFFQMQSFLVKGAEASANRYSFKVSESSWMSHTHTHNAEHPGFAKTCEICTSKPEISIVHVNKIESL